MGEMFELGHLAGGGGHGTNAVHQSDHFCGILLESLTGELVAVICDEFARRLSTLIDKSSKYRFYYDRILGFRNAAEERRALHTSA